MRVMFIFCRPSEPGIIALMKPKKQLHLGRGKMSKTLKMVLEGAKFGLVGQFLSNVNDDVDLLENLH